MANKKFSVTRDHIKLVKSINVVWNEFANRPFIDNKRPYGDGNIPKSIAEAIDLDFVEMQGGEMMLTSQQEKYCWQLNKDMATVLQIVLSAGLFKTGEYECEEYDNQWKKISK